MTSFTMAANRSTSPAGTEKSSSSCTWIMSWAAKPSDKSRRCTSFIAILMMSAALPCMGWFMAVRSPKARCWPLELFSSGMWRLRPSMVSAKPRSFASATVSSK